MRGAGILLPVSSLASRYGVGTLGAEAYHFVDFLAGAGQKYWQILPLGPTGYGDSPYQSFSSFAGNPYFIDLETLCLDGLLTEEECGVPFGNDPEKANYGLLYKNRLGVLKKAFVRFVPGEDYFTFTERHKEWVFDYGLFMALKTRYGPVPFTAWPEDVKKRNRKVLEPLRAELLGTTVFHIFLQYLFDKQWQALRHYANERGVRIIGDTPIYAAADSADVWGDPELFLLDGNCTPMMVAGCPPDAFSADGQLWGNPLYRWDKMREDGFAWWIKRMKRAADLYDVVRIDHFRGLESYYAIPADNRTAADGHWEKGPGKEFICALKAALPDFSIIAEDLGFLTTEVRELLAFSGYPGMKVFQFAFDDTRNSDYLLHNCTAGSVMYTGTHDNPTTEQWLAEGDPTEVGFAKAYLGADDKSFTDRFICAALMSPCDTCIIPIGDYLHLSAEGRINTPSTPDGNWVWRLCEGQLTDDLQAKIRTLTKLYAR